MPEEKTTKKAITFHEKLVELQKRIEPIKKDSINPHFKNKYFDINSLLEAVKPNLNDLGLVLIQPIKITESGMILSTKIFDDSDAIYCEMALPEIADPQKMGGAITYYRRYSLQSLLGLQAEDDDGNTASDAVIKKKNYSGEGLLYEEVNGNVEDDGVECTQCSAVFIPKFPGAKLCYACYKKNN